MNYYKIYADDYIKYSIDKDEMKRYGQILAQNLDPLGPRIREQSPATIVGELIFLLQACDMHNDKQGANYVARAIKDLLENHENLLADCHQAARCPRACRAPACRLHPACSDRRPC